MLLMLLLFSVLRKEEKRSSPCQRRRVLNLYFKKEFCYACALPFHIFRSVLPLFALIVASRWDYNSSFRVDGKPSHLLRILTDVRIHTHTGTHSTHIFLEARASAAARESGHFNQPNNPLPYFNLLPPPFVTTCPLPPSNLYIQTPTRQPPIHSYTMMTTLSLHLRSIHAMKAAFNGWFSSPHPLKKKKKGNVQHSLSP